MRERQRNSSFKRMESDINGNTSCLILAWQILKVDPNYRFRNTFLPHENREGQDIVLIKSHKGNIFHL